MTENRPFRTSVTVRFVKRDDGGLQAHCDEVRGFYLSGRDPRAVMRDVIPTLEALMKVNLDIDVHVSPLGRGVFQLREAAPPPIDALSEETEYSRLYVIEKVAA